MARLIVENVATLPTPSNNNNNNGGTINKSSSSSHASLSGVQRKFITDAIRYPEKQLGSASLSVSPEYLFSENKGRYGLRQQHQQQSDDGTNESSCIPLSRLALEVKEAVASDPMYGE